MYLLKPGIVSGTCFYAVVLGGLKTKHKRKTVYPHYYLNVWINKYDDTISYERYKQENHIFYGNNRNKSYNHFTLQYPYYYFHVQTTRLWTFWHNRLLRVCLCVAIFIFLAAIRTLSMEAFCILIKRNNNFGKIVSIYFLLILYLIIK